MLNMNLAADINSILYLQYMTEQAARPEKAPAAAADPHYTLSFDDAAEDPTWQKNGLEGDLKSF